MSINLKEIHEECAKIFEEELVEDSGRTLACEIYDVMVNGNEEYENCIGENFNQLIHNLRYSWFMLYHPAEDTHIEFYTYTYLFWLYLFLERIEFIINQIDPERKFGPIKEFHRNLKTMDEIRVWANFIKHPKNFLFVHWPNFTFVGQKIEKTPDTILINTSFLKAHYSSERQDKPESIENKNEIIVLFPKLPTLTKGFCKELKEFIRFICDNKMIAQALEKKSNRKI